MIVPLIGVDRCVYSVELIEEHENIDLSQCDDYFNFNFKVEFLLIRRRTFVAHSTLHRVLEIIIQTTANSFYLSLA